MSEFENLSLRLPQIPKDSYYEDYVAAILNAGGYYLQRSVHRCEEGVEMLELDVVATKITPDKVSKIVVEIKSGGWGIRDVFKVAGWLQYLKIKDASGAFIFQNEVHQHDYAMMKKTADELHIGLIQNNRKADDRLDDAPLKGYFGINIEGIHKSVIFSFRYAFNMERVFLDYVNQYSKDYPQFESPKIVYEYLRKLNNESFLYQEPVSRLQFLSKLSYDYRYIGGIMYHEIKGEGVMDPEEHPDFNGDYYNIFLPKKSELTPIYVAQYATLLNKLYVLETIVEYIVRNKQLEPNSFQYLIDQTNLNTLNGNIRGAIECLKSKSNYHLYPYFWQVFIYVFGGFILIDKKNEEYELLSQITKVPQNEIDVALNIWNILFPLYNGWFQQPTAVSNILFLKMMPAPLYGIGANFRLHLYGTEKMEKENGLFDNLKAIVSRTHTFDDVNGWNNVAFFMLKRDTNLHVCDLHAKGKYEKRLTDVDRHIRGCGRYNRVVPFKDIIQQKHIKDELPNGFVAYYNDDSYDVYAIKNNNRNEKLNVFQFAKSLKLNESQFVNGVILGTDDSVADDVADKLWYFSRFDQASLDRIETIIKESNTCHGK